MTPTIEELAPVQRPSFWALADDLEAYRESLVLVESELAQPLRDEERAEIVQQRVEIVAHIERISAELLTKTDALAGVIRRMESDAAAIKAEEHRLRERRHRAEEALDALKVYAIHTMQEHRWTKLKTERNTIAIRGNGGAQQLETKLDVLPREYKTVLVKMSLPDWEDVALGTAGEVVSTEPNNKAIREALAAGATIEGAELLPRGSHLRLS
jgi:Siphovirus Gp157